ncbi:hypothetical protein F5544_32485 [Nocardia arthritidis]|uniref:Uncharacterized protein n=1 Tax=Nocardia arthritidis TaxID=228602 RepID=A0A6G9YM97_9NOCA|nr:hypothetical protein F5544_32485 [Nocardia arthritidis]
MHTLRTGSDRVAQAATAISTPVADYHSSLGEMRGGIKSAIETAEIVIGASVVVGLALTVVTFGGSDAAAAGTVAAAIANCLNAIRTVWNTCRFIRIVAAVAAVGAGAAAVATVFNNVPELRNFTTTSLAAIAALAIAIADAGDDKERTSGPSKEEVKSAEEHANDPDDVLDTGFPIDELAQLTHQHTGAGEVYDDRPSEQEIEDALRHAKPEQLKNDDGTWQNSWKYEYNGIRVIVNRGNPLRSTSYRM